MKLKNNEVFQAVIGLSQLGGRKLPPVTATAIADQKNALKGHFQEIDDLRKELLTKWEKVEVEGKPTVTISLALPDWQDNKAHPNFKDFYAEYRKLMDTEVDVNFSVIKWPQTYKAVVDGKLVDLPLDVESGILELLRPKFLELG